MSQPGRAWRARPGGHSAVLVCMAFVLGFWSITIHAEHNAAHAGAHESAAHAAINATLQRAPIHSIGEPQPDGPLSPHETLQDCAIPNVLRPAPEMLPDLLLAVFGSEPPRPVADVQRQQITRVVDIVERPPGPTRQARLQCFRL